MSQSTSPFALPNVKAFIAFRLLFNARFYYPIFTILFLDMGLTLEQFASLNAVWAATIVLMEVPSGAFADIFGRRNLLVAASICMIVEMCLLCFVPLGNNNLIFYAMLLNRIISGGAEALASGADEALAYDTIKAKGMEEQWPAVLQKLMTFQSGAFFFAMLTGAFLYDADFVNRILSFFGSDITFAAETTLRFPLYLCLASALATFFVTLKIKEVTHAEADKAEKPHIGQAFALTFETGKWIVRSGFVATLIVTALFYDSIIRMFLTLGSEYYRTIRIPEAALGVMGAGMSLIGLTIPTVAKKLVEKQSPLKNFSLLGVLIFFGLLGLQQVWPWWGIVPAMLLGASMYFLGFFLSHYLNKEVESSRRATVLSFRGLACNLAYGIVGLLYMALASHLRSQAPEGAEIETNAIFVQSLNWLPGYFLLTVLLLALFAWLKKRKTLADQG